MATAEIPHASKEEENYSRMRLLVIQLGTRAVRVFFDKEFNPSSLYKSIKEGYSRLNDMLKKGVINKEQRKLLFPGGSSKY